MGILARDLAETTKDELREALLPFFTKKTGTGYDGKSLPYRLLARNLYELFFEYTRATLTYTILAPEAGEFSEAAQANEQRSIDLNDADFPYAFLDNIPLDTEIIVTTFDGETWKGVLKQITRVSSPSYVRLICDVSETTTFVAGDDAVIEIKHTSDTFFNNQDGTAVLDDQLVFIDQTDNRSKRATIKVLFDLLGSKESGTAVAGDSIAFIDATDNLVKKEKISAILDLLGSKESGTAVAGDSIAFIDATDNLVKQSTLSTMLDLLGSKEDGTAVDGDKIVFVDATDSIIKQVTISTMFDLLSSKPDDTPLFTSKMLFVDTSGDDNVVRQATIDAMLDLLYSKEDGIAVLSDKLIFADATESIIKQESISDILNLLNNVPKIAAAADDELIFIDTTSNSVRRETIESILDLKTLTEIFDSDNGVTASTSMNRTVDEGFDNFSAIIFEMRLNNNRIVTPFVPLDVWEDTTENARIAGSYQDPYFTLYRVNNTTFRYYAGASGMRLYKVYGF